MDFVQGWRHAIDDVINMTPKHYEAVFQILS